jgi:hypothetical protein
MIAPAPYHSYDVEYIDVCRMMLIEVPHLHLQYWHSYAEIEELSRTPGFFRPLYRFALTLFPSEAINADPLCDMSELLNNVQHTSGRQSKAASDYPYYLPQVLQGSQSNSNGSGE